MKPWSLLASTAALAALLAGGCTTLDERQREWIFQPSDQSWGNSASYSEGMEQVWIDYRSPVNGEQVRLHGLWYGDHREPAGKPVMLYLHGARYNVEASAPRMRRMHDLGFSVLAIDYRGFGKSTKELPSEESAREDARAAWAWLAARHPHQPRYIFGHSLGGAIGIDLASRVDDEQGVIVESTFTSIADVVSSFKWGWLPLRPFVTQRFEAIDRVKDIGSPLLVVHGDADSLINPTLGRKLYEAATGPKQFVLVQGGSHHNANSIGQAQYRAALTQLFRMKEPSGEAPVLAASPAPRLAPATARSKPRPAAWPQPADDTAAQPRGAVVGRADDQAGAARRVRPDPSLPAAPSMPVAESADVAGWTGPSAEPAAPHEPAGARTDLHDASIPVERVDAGSDAAPASASAYAGEPPPATGGRSI